MARRSKKKPLENHGKIGVRVMVRDVLVHSIDRGQLPQAAVALLVIIAAVRMPSDDLSKFVFEILDVLVDSSLLGWILAMVAIIGWGVHVRRQRQWWTSEMNRVADERSKWQKRALPKEDLGSSES